MASKDSVDEDDIEALASKACALASVPIPDYADAIERSNIRSKAKYGNRFTLDDNETTLDVEKELNEDDGEFSSGIVLAERTSQILSNFQDYVDGINNNGEDSGKKILEGSSTKGVTDIARKDILEDNKKRLLDGKPISNKILRRKSSGGSSTYSADSGSGLQREWSHEGTRQQDELNSRVNIHDASSINSWEDPERGWMHAEYGIRDMISRRRDRRRSYTHPILQSKRVKLGIVNCLVVAVVVLGVSLSMSNSSHKAVDKLDDELTKVEADIEGNTVDTMWNKEEVDAAMEGKGDHATIPSDNNDDNAEKNNMPSKEDMMQAGKYQAAMYKYQPKEFARKDGWQGKTYLDAYQFCKTVPDKDETIGNYDICPFEAVCPLGINSQPLGGYKDDTEHKSWLPISDNSNDWVQISKKESCIKYSSLNEFAPDWGISGSEAIDIVNHVMCCLSDDYVHGFPTDINMIDGAFGKFTGWALGIDSIGLQKDDPNYHLYLDTANQYLPLEFDRSKGWDGRTYAEALEFCGRLSGYEICPYEALCPSGSDNVPLGGNKNDVKGSWAPILNSNDDWVQIGISDQCIKYSHQHGEPPDWSNSGIDSEEITRHIYCCALPEVDNEVEDELEQNELAAKEVFEEEKAAAEEAKDEYEAAAKEAEIQAKFEYEHEEMAAKEEIEEEKEAAEEYKLELFEHVYENATLTYMPKKYNREKGWFGTTYLDAVEFCSSSEEGYSICSYDALCPLGRHTEPLGGFIGNSDDDKAYMPIADDINSWVLVSKDNSCDAEEQPDWDTFSLVQTEVYTRHIMCCANVEKMPGNPEEEDKKEEEEKEVEESYMLAAQKYHPVLYDRENDGYSAQTYVDALEFCESKREGITLCPYEAVCPMANLDSPLGGVVEDAISWVPIGDGNNMWVSVSSSNTCELYEVVNGETPLWGITGKGNEECTRHVMCCETHKKMNNGAGYGEVMKVYSPRWYDRTQGWDGHTYQEAITFCARQDSSIPCPYQAYCPLGIGTTPTGGYDGKEEAWAAIIDSPNAWVQIGSYEKDSIANECTKYTSLHDAPPLWGLILDESIDRTPHIMCCKEPPDHIIDGMEDIVAAAAETEYEQTILDEMNPVWFSSKDGYSGTTYENAVEFCNNISDMVLCPSTAYCPSDTDSKKLFLNKDPFLGNQWAPATSEFGTQKHLWISIGEETTCSIHEDQSKLQLPSWALDGGREEEKKEHVLCCQNPKHLEKEHSLTHGLNPIWMDERHGWNGGSHSDAASFCSTFSNRKICPYIGLCPHGPGQDVIGGHKQDFNTQELWAPVFGDHNRWVMIGQKYQNRATTCMDNIELEGEEIEPRSDQKKYIACCTF